MDCLGLPSLIQSLADFMRIINKGNRSLVRLEIPHGQRAYPHRR